MEVRDLIILGGGPAGLTSAIYAGRALLDTLVITEGITSSQLFLSTGVEDYPGFPEIISGYELLKSMEKQAKKFQIDFLEKKAIAVDLKVHPYKVITEDQKEHFSKSIIIATGASHKLLGLEKEKDFIGKGISVCAICDGFFYKDKIVAVIGGGDSAVKEAIYLSKYAQKVYLIYRSKELKAAPVLQKRLTKEKNIEPISPYEVIKLIGEKTLEKIIIKNKETEEEKEIKIDGMFLAIGSKPNTDLFKDQLELLPSGHIKTYDLVKTQKEGVFAAGEVMDPFYRQAITSCGFGAIAALEAEKWLKNYQ
ncbi:MAG: thioredoxin-disulfide reductase [Minisyncoccia bacterium]